MGITIEINFENLIYFSILFIVGKKLLQIWKQWQTDKLLEKYNNTPKDKVIVHTVWRCKTLPSVSPFTLKLETYLRMAKIPYEIETKDAMGPKGKTPWISYNGTHIADSQLCIDFLNRKFDKDLNKNGSTEKQVAVARACRILLEDHFLWGVIQHRWVENPSSVPTLLRIPFPLNHIMFLTGWKLKSRMDSNGLGLHTHPELYQMMESDLHAVSEVLGKNPYFGGSQPCEEDSAIFGMIAQCLWAMPGSTYEKMVKGELKNLQKYCLRMKEEYWPDWEDCVDKTP